MRLSFNQAAALDDEKCSNHMTNDIFLILEEKNPFFFSDESDQDHILYQPEVQNNNTAP